VRKPPIQGDAAVQSVHFPKPFEHAHPAVRNVNESEVEALAARTNGAAESSS